MGELLVLYGETVAVNLEPFRPKHREGQSQRDRGEDTDRQVETDQQGE